MLNTKNNDELARFSREYQRNGYVVIPEIFDNEFAEELSENIISRSDWDIVTLREKKPFLVGNKELMALPPASRGQFINEILQSANKDDFQYLYEFVRILGPDSITSSEFDKVRDSIASKEFKGYFEKVINKSIVTVDAKITKYMAGYFLKQHCDVANDGQSKRAAAYVISLSKNWKADWGGLLNIQNDDGEVIKTITPKFNSIVLFKVPQQHFVSQVANFCSEKRYSATGWFWKK